MRKIKVDKNIILVIAVALFLLPLIIFTFLLSVRYLYSVEPVKKILDNSLNQSSPSKVNVAAELRDCLPKSDMASKAKCDSLLKTITNFEDCVNAGLPVLDSYPEQCELPDGRKFVSTAQSGCRSDGYLCPGGTMVGRIPPSCEFAPCPSIDPAAKTTTLVGEYVCLPHKDKNGPITLECAFGIKTDDGFYYALDTTDYKTDYSKLITGKKITVEGLLIPIQAISSDQYQKYDIKGVMRVKIIQN